MNKKTMILKTILLLVLGISAYISYSVLPMYKSYVYAEHNESKEKEEDEKDDDEKEKEEDEKDDDDDEEYDYVEYTIYEGENIPNSYISIEPEFVETPVIRYITLIDPGYDIDSDNDLLVDALDPNPNIPQQLFFTDTDDDGVPDVTDAYPNEDDFKYTVFEDTNNNGIADYLE